MNTPWTATHVFYSKKQKCIIDTCTNEETPRSHIEGETLEEIRKRYPDAVYMLFDDAIRVEQESCKLPVSEITEKEFWYALEVLPPNGWEQEHGRESFKMSEHWSGAITGIYARIGERYFVLRDHYRLPHAVIMARCEEFIQKENQS